MIKLPSNLKLRDYQIEGVKHLMSGQRRLLLDDPGLGKTCQALVAAASLGAKRILVIVPPATRWGWAEEVVRWTHYKPQVLVGTMAWLDPNADCYILSYSLLNSPMILDQIKQRWPVCIVDEVHFCKTLGTNRTEQIFGKRSKGIATNSVYLWGLSGTLMTNTPRDLFPIMRGMGNKWLGKYRQQRAFQYRFCDAFMSGYGLDDSGASNLKQLNHMLFNSGLALRRLKGDVLKDLPDITYRLMPIEGDKVVHAAFKKWDKVLRRQDFSGKLPVSGEELAKARKEVSLAKEKCMFEYIKYRLEEHPKILQFFWHKVGVKAMDLNLKCDSIESACYFGPMSATQKEEAKSDFINGDVQVINANYQSAGVGLDGFQKVCSYGVFYDIPWCFTEIQQCAGRLHRFGQGKPVLIDIPVIMGTAEQYVMKKVFEKENYFESVLDNA